MRYGTEMPVDPTPGSREYNDLCNALYAWMGEFVSGIAAYVKQEMPELAVEFNYAHGVTGGMRTGCGEEVDAYPVAPFTVRVKCDRAPKAVTLLPEGKPVKFSYRNGFVSFLTRKLHIFDMYRIEL